ncbi:MAG: molecular chaperone HscC [Oscillospiraceae bacterium]|nr:molecular chaperone HscC [Candidatus Limimonas egerieequi]
MAIVGIDLGTTNSLVCVYRGGKSELIPNSFGEFLTPSCVGLDDDGEQVLVGKIAKDRLVSHPDFTVSSFKRFMGTDKKLIVGERVFTAPELSSFVIRQLKEDAEAYLGEPVEEAVISVPAYFDDNGRNATKMAGELAGLRVERIINEPSAAALAYRKDDDEDATFLVCDLGGGTFDVSVVDAFDNIIEIAAVAGDNHLGGDDWNAAIAQYFCDENGIKVEDLSPETKAIILKQAEMCKIALNSSEPIIMSVSIGPDSYMASLTSKKLVEISASLFKRIEEPIRRALHDASMTVMDIDYVVMVGGSSKMLTVSKYIEQLVGREMKSDIDPDKVVGIGAGVVAGIKSRDEDIKDTILTDVCPFTLGTNVINYAKHDDPLFSPIIERNSVLPTSHMERYYTVNDNQDKMVFKIYQGENMYCRDNTLLGDIEIKVPKNKAGEECCEVRFTYDINGILEVDVKCVSTGETKNKVILNKNIKLTDEEIALKQAELQKLKILPRDEEENKAIIARAERLYEEAFGEFRDIIGANTMNFLEILSKQDSKKIRRAKTQFVKFLDMVEGQEAGFDVFMRDFDFDDSEDDD